MATKSVKARRSVKGKLVAVKKAAPKMVVKPVAGNAPTKTMIALKAKVSASTQAPRTVEPAASTEPARESRQLNLLRAWSSTRYVRR